jgi:beta-galactosidase
MVTADISEKTTELRRVRLCRSGLDFDGRLVPLLVGSVHYFHLDPKDWRPALSAIAKLGFRGVDTYVPWSVHEIERGKFDFGTRSARLDVAEFLRIAEELGLYAIVRPGPHVNAELTGFGIPKRVLWDAECQARSPSGDPVILPIPPLAFPVPSYASPAFRHEVSIWYRALGAALGPLVWPAGPICIVQVDNEGAFYFRDAPFDQDYHPDAVAKYRRFVGKRYSSTGALRRVYGDPAITADTLEPPHRLGANTALDLTRYLDWIEFQEWLLADALGTMRKTLVRSGFSGAIMSHNLPPGSGASALDPARIARAVEFLGADFYSRAGERERKVIARDTSELAARADKAGHPAFASELGVGFAPYFAPISETDTEFVALSALAYGMRGFNAYMAVERDRWIGAPIDRHGKERPSARFWERLLSAVERTRLYELTRFAPVQIVRPRCMMRLRRALHAFGPVGPMFFEILGEDARAHAFEEELGLPSSVLLDAEEFLGLVQAELDRRGIPYGWATGDLVKHTVRQASWTIVACPGALDVKVIEAVERAMKRRRAVSLGPHYPERDASMRPLRLPVALPSRANSDVPTLIGLSASSVERAVARAQAALELRAFEIEPADVRVTLHQDASGRPKVAFALNPTASPLRASIPAFGALSVVDALDGERIVARADRIDLSIPGHSVRMLAVELDT